MKLSFLTLLFKRFPLEYCFKVAHDYGFEGIEIWGGRPHAYYYDMDKQAIADLNSWKKKYGLEISMFVPEILSYPYNMCSRLATERRDAVDYLVKSTELAAAMGTERIQITAPHPGYLVNKDEVWEHLVYGLTKISERAGELGVKVIIEHLSYSEGGDLLTTADDLVKVIRDVNRPALYSMIDVVPPFLANEPYAECLEKLGEKMDYLHLCNNDGVSEVHTPLDDPNGVLPLKDFFRVIKRYGYNGWASIELLAPYFREPEMYLAGSIKYLESILDEVGIARG